MIDSGRPLPSGGAVARQNGAARAKPITEEVFMAIKSLGDPFDPDTRLEHGSDCVCASCRTEVAGLRLADKQRTALLERQLETRTPPAIPTRRRRVSMMLQQKEALRVTTKRQARGRMPGF